MLAISAAVCAVLFVAAPLLAQPALTIKRTVLNWPTVRIHFTASCDGVQEYTLGAGDVTITEEGVIKSVRMLHCTDPAQRCVQSVAMVLDASGSMIGSSAEGAKLAAKTYIARLDGSSDEAALFFFNTDVKLQKAMTRDKIALAHAVDSMLPSGPTALWNAAYAGIEHVNANGHNPCKAVVVLTDGADNVSTKTAAECIALAQRVGIRVFTVAIGSSTNATALDQLATLSGGRFFQTPNAAQLAAIFNDIFDIIALDGNECVAEYETRCPDGSMRSGTLAVSPSCGGTVSAPFSFGAIDDSTLYDPVPFALDTVAVKGGDEALLRFTLHALPVDVTFSSLDATLRFDANQLDFVGLVTSAGDALHNAGVTVSPVAGGLRLQCVATQPIALPALLGSLRFSTRSVSDTMCAGILVEDVVLDAQCVRPVVFQGAVCLYPPAPLLSCSVRAPSAARWDSQKRSFIPGTFVTTLLLRNDGDAAATALRARIVYDGNRVQLASGQNDVVQLSAALAAGARDSVSWTFTPLMAASSDTVVFTIVTESDNHPLINCDASVVIDAAPARLLCDLDVPVIVANQREQRYDPMPFELTMSIVNDGGASSDLVRGRIVLPASLNLDAPDTADDYIKTLPSGTLARHQVGYLRWSLRHEPSTSGKTLPVTVWLSNGDRDSVSCTINVTIPALQPWFLAAMAGGSQRTRCGDDTLWLDAGDGYVVYEWSTGASTRQLAVTAAGSYYCRLQDAGGRYGTTDTVWVVDAPRPAVPGITRALDVLSTNANAARFQWYRNGLPLPGETTRDLQLRTPGSYTLMVYNAEGCGAMSDPFDVTVLSTFDATTVQRFDVFPEPNDGECTVSLQLFHPERVSVVVNNILGQEVLRITSAVPVVSFREIVRLHGFPAGVYVLDITAGESRWMRSIIRR